MWTIFQCLFVCMPTIVLTVKQTSVVFSVFWFVLCDMLQILWAGHVYMHAVFLCSRVCREQENTN